MFGGINSLNNRDPFYKRSQGKCTFHTETEFSGTCRGDTVVHLLCSQTSAAIPALSGSEILNIEMKTI